MIFWLVFIGGFFFFPKLLEHFTPHNFKGWNAIILLISWALFWTGICLKFF